MTKRINKENINRIRLALEKNEEHGNSVELMKEDDFSCELDLLTAVEKIVEMSKNSKMSREFFRNADRYISYISDKLELTKVQSVFMALFIEWSDETKIRTSEIGDYLNCGTTRMLKYSSDIDELERREFLRCSRGERYVSYVVPMEVLESFKNDEMHVPRDLSGLSCMDFFEELGELFALRIKKELNYDFLVNKIKSLLKQNCKLLFVQRLKNYDLEDDDKILLIFFSHLLVNESDEHVTFRELELLYDSVRKFHRMKMLLSVGNHVLMRRNYIEFHNDGGFVKRDYYCLSRGVKDDLFSELDQRLFCRDSRRGDMIKAEDIVEKQMFYDGKISTYSSFCRLNPLSKSDKYMCFERSS